MYPVFYVFIDNTTYTIFNDIKVVWNYLLHEKSFIENS